MVLKEFHRDKCLTDRLFFIHPNVHINLQLRAFSIESYIITVCS